MRLQVFGLTVASLLAGLTAAPVWADQGAGGGATVERQLRHRLATNPDDPVVLARLARLYATTDRPAKARRLYGALLTLDDVELERNGGAPVSSRLLAKSALSQLDAPKPLRMGSR